MCFDDSIKVKDSVEEHAYHCLVLMILGCFDIKPQVYDYG